MTDVTHEDHVARAIYEARFPDHGTRYGEKSWQDQSPEVKIVWRKCAAAAIAATVPAVRTHDAVILDHMAAEADDIWRRTAKSRTGRDKGKAAAAAYRAGAAAILNLAGQAR